MKCKVEGLTGKKQFYVTLGLIGCIAFPILLFLGPIMRKDFTMLTKQSKALYPTSCSGLADRSTTALFVLVAFLSSFFILTDSALAASTSVMTHTIPLTGYCNNPSPHCYATRDWLGHTGGSKTLINPYGALSCYGCSGFIDSHQTPCLKAGACS